MATKVSIPALIQALGGKENLAQATHLSLIHISHAVAAVGDVGIGQRVVCVTEGAQRKEKVLVAAVAGHDLVRLQTEVCRRGLEQVGAGGVGVKAQLFHLVLAHGGDHRCV